MALVTDPHNVLRQQRRKQKSVMAMTFVLLIVILTGLIGGYLLHGLPAGTGMQQANSQIDADMAALASQVTPVEGYSIPATLGDIGPRLLASGAIDLGKFVDVYEQSGKPLTREQQAMLKKGGNGLIVIDGQNAYFLLNFFWALGLANTNPVLTAGEMMSKGRDQVGNFASTGGWTLGAKPATDLYAGNMILPLSEQQQLLLDRVASAVYRPCCDNSTHFPDCNHGMAMLGLLELMASQDASEEDMFNAAKYINAYWYPQQMLEIAAYFKANQNVDFSKAGARQLVSSQYSSLSGFQGLHLWLANNSLLPEAPNTSGSCSVQ